MKSKIQIIEIIKENGSASVSYLSKRLGISTQALHRLLKDLAANGVLQKVGSPPKTSYRLLTDVKFLSKALAKQMQECASILGHHPAIRLVSLFGSQARGEANENSDIDLLVWVEPKEGFHRQEIWSYWDRHTRHLPWRDKVSLVVRKLDSQIYIDTLLLDFPEEHLLVYDSAGLYAKLKKSVTSWREKWNSQKVSSFGGKHSWKYTTKVNRLADIDFKLELDYVA